MLHKILSSNNNKTNQLNSKPKASKRKNNDEAKLNDVENGKVIKKFGFSEMTQISFLV